MANSLTLNQILIIMTKQCEQERIFSVLKKISKQKKVSIKDFKQGPVLGSGTFGVVKQVFYKKKSSKQPFALKILDKSQIVEKDQV